MNLSSNKSEARDSIHIWQQSRIWLALYNLVNNVQFIQQCAMYFNQLTFASTTHRKLKTKKALNLIGTS